MYLDKNMILKIIYTFFIGVLFAIFVGVGIEAFYPSPKMPEFPAGLNVPIKEGAVNEATFQEIKKLQENYDNQTKDYRSRQQNYNRNVSMIALAVAVLALIVSLTFFKKILLIADGLLLGGVLTLFYSMIRGFDSGNDMFRFLVVSAGLAIALILGYLKFIRPAQS